MFKEKERQLPRAELKWPILAQTSKGLMRGETRDVSANGAYIRCPRPLRLNEVVDLAIKIPKVDRPIIARAEVIWSNLYGPDDEVNPRGMGVRFLDITDEDRRFIAEVVNANREQVIELEDIETVMPEIAKN